MEKNPIDTDYVIDRFRNGIVEITHNKAKAIMAIIYSMLFVAWVISGNGMQDTDASIPDVTGSMMMLKTVLFIAGTAIMVFIFGAPLDVISVDRKLMKIGLVNRFGEPPHLMRRYKDGTSDVWILYTSGISIEDVENVSDAIEAVLNRIYIRCDYEADRKHIALYLVSIENDIPENISWSERFLSSDANVITLGMGLAGQVVNDLSIIPHMMIGGATNTGKSILVKCILYQCMMHGDRIIIADKKGGVDYTALSKWCQLITTEDDFEAILLALITELETRLQILKVEGCPNAAKYNEHSEYPMRRIVLAVDEVAEWLDKSGVSKEDKQHIDKLIGYLSTLARLGRATNITLIMSQQRPDANVLPGQIKAQLGCRIAGRCDDVLSQIILDNTDAATKIPHNARGLFLNQDGELFRGFFISDDQIKARGWFISDES